MKTLWIINQYASTPATGLGGRHYYIARELAKMGVRVYVIGSAAHHLLREKPQMRSAFKIEEVDGFSFVWIKMPDYEHAHSKRRVLGWLWFPGRLLRLPSVVPFKPDAILCSSPSPFAFIGAKRLAVKTGARLVFEVRDIWPLTLTEIGGQSPSNPFIRIMQWVEDKAYRESHRVVSNLKNSVEHMVSRGMERAKFSWVPNGFSRDEVGQNVPLNEASRQQVPKGKFIVGYTGTIGVANSLDTVLNAAELLSDQPNIHFVLVGGGKEKAELLRMCKERALENVTFIDPIPKVEIQAMLSLFDVCYIGLSKDPLFRFGVSPNKLFDYLYAGKPIIYGIESGDYRPVEDVNAGVQIPAQDTKALVEAVVHLYRMSEEARFEMGQRGKALAESRHEYSQLAEQLAKALFE